MEKKPAPARKPRTTVKKAKIETGLNEEFTYESEPPAPQAPKPPVDRRMDNNFVLVCGAPKRGKSHWIRWYICDGMRQGKWDYIVVLSPTKSSDPNFSDWGFLDQDCIWDDPTTYEAALTKIVNNQKIIVNRVGHPPLPGEGRILLVCDDCLGSMQWNKPIWQNLSSTFRHKGIDLLISTQASTRLPYFMYEMATLGIIFRMDVQRAVDIVWDRWVAAFDTGKKNSVEFMAYMKEKMPLNDHLFLQIDRNPNAENNIKLTRAPPKQQFEKIRISFKKQH